MFRFEHIDIWREAVQYAECIYSCIQQFPVHEKYALANQLRRSAVSISANIAEGAASQTDKEFRAFLGYSIRSVAENVSELYVACRLGYISPSEYDRLYGDAERLIKRISSFRKALAISHQPSAISY